MIRRILPTVAVLSTATGLVWLYAAAARWRDLHIAACRRIVELERLLRWERAQADEQLVTARLEADALEVALATAQQDARFSATVAHKALEVAEQRIDALTEAVRAQRVVKTCRNEIENDRTGTEMDVADGEDLREVKCNDCGYTYSPAMYGGAGATCPKCIDEQDAAHG
jgi:hypothetical protein